MSDLLSLRQYIAQDHPATAQSVAQRILATIAYLRDHPEIGRPGRTPGTRELVVAGIPYIIPYRVRRDTIELLRVFHTSRKWPEESNNL